MNSNPSRKRHNSSYNFTTTKDHITNTLGEIQSLFSLLMPSKVHPAVSFTISNFFWVWRWSYRCIVSHHSYISNTSLSMLVRNSREDIKMHYSCNTHLLHQMWYQIAPRTFKNSEQFIILWSNQNSTAQKKNHYPRKTWCRSSYLSIHKD